LLIIHGEEEEQADRRLFFYENHPVVLYQFYYNRSVVKHNVLNDYTNIGLMMAENSRNMLP
jgi:hypothetical protein